LVRRPGAHDGAQSIQGVGIAHIDHRCIVKSEPIPDPRDTIQPGNENQQWPLEGQQFPQARRPAFSPGLQPADFVHHDKVCPPASIKGLGAGSKPRFEKIEYPAVLRMGIVPTSGQRHALATG